MVTVIDNKTTSSSKDPFTEVRNLLLAKIDDKRYLLKLNKVINEIELYKYKNVDPDKEEFDLKVKISPDYQNCNFMFNITSPSQLSLLTIILAYTLFKDGRLYKTFSQEFNIEPDQYSNLIHALISCEKENIKFLAENYKRETKKEFQGLNFIIRDLGGTPKKITIGLDFNVPKRI